MKYLIMNARVIHQFSTDRLNAPVGVLKLDYKTTTAISRLLGFTKQNLDAVPHWHWGKDPYVHLVSSEFTGPSVHWITSLSAVPLSGRQKEQFQRNRYVVTNRKPAQLTGVVWSQSRFSITMYEQMYWECDAGETYKVYGPPTNKWERIANNAVKHLLVEANKEPLSWEDARYMLRFTARYYGIYKDETELANPGVIVKAIETALKDDQYRENLTPVEIVRLETTRRHWGSV